MDLPSFIKRWLESSGTEAPNAKPFIMELCNVLGVAAPAPGGGVGMVGAGGALSSQVAPSSQAFPGRW